MKQTSLFSIFLLLFPLFCAAQTKIDIQLNDITADSLFIRAMNKEYQMETIFAEAFKPVTTFNSKLPVEPGIYWIMADSNLVDAFLISDNKNQQFSISVNKENSVYVGSEENTRYHNYIQYLFTFDSQMQQLDIEYQQARQSMPQYMLGVVLDSLNQKALRINQNKSDYQISTIRENKGTLFASVIAASMSIPQPAKEILKEQKLLQEHYAKHFFDHFPWEDARIYRTAIVVKKINEFCQFIAQCNRPDFDAQIMAYLDSSKVTKEGYYAFFDQIEKLLGDHASPMRIERLYIQMLKDMLTVPQLSEERTRHCRYELGTINKNNVGDIVPDFNLLLNNGQKTSLYQISSEYMLLYLQHPTCPTCQQIRRTIANYPILNRAIATGKLKVLTVYFEDEQSVWDNYIHSSEANSTYIHGWNYDQSIEEKKLYDTRAIPFMFILDKEKRVIVKNVSELKLEDEIKKLNILN